ncbi:alpha-ketoglutarate-dependent dioxygenase AlkB [Vulgatibacter sp.]|uniref:alpha-ketoglutarate-dependent dioxygenase AlkB n=1 Tax=Vulgatibacter sp. TaxID=1971226 RepID=UPI003562B972
MRARSIDVPPAGFLVQEAFVDEAEERAILAELEARTFREVRMHGVVARRTVLHFGWTYAYESWRIERGEPLPSWLHALREKAAAIGGLEAAALGQCLVSRYPPGAGIGWHRDAPMFGPVVVGISLGAACRFKLRRTVEEGPEVYAATLEPRSAYVLGGEARTAWQHTIPAVKALRHSITFRTVKDPAKWDRAAAAEE